MNASRDESGSVALWTAMSCLTILILGGVVIDGGYVLDARRGADRIAEQAARLAADQVDSTSLHTGNVSIDAEAAHAAAINYLRHQGVSGNVTVDNDAVTVTVTDYQASSVLGVIGWDGATVEGSATAETVDGQPVINP